MQTSSSDTELVNAATSRHTLKRIMKNQPNGICEKITGMVTNTSPGPALGSWPMANTAGMIMRPARSAV